MVKATFTLDEPTVERLRRVAARLGKPQSHVLREAIQDYAARVGKLGEEERRRLLHAFDTLVPKIPPRSLEQVEAELREIRAGRRQGWGRGRPRRRK